MASHRTKDKRDGLILALYREACRIQEIAERAECSKETVYRVIRRNGLTPPGRYKRKIDQERERRILTLRRQGWTFRAIGEAVGCSSASAHRMVSESGQFLMTKPRITADDVKRILSLRNRGEELWEIAEAVHRATSSVVWVLANPRLLVSLRRKEMRTKARNQRILALRQRGKSFSEIANVIGLPMTTVRLIYRKQAGDCS